MRYDKLNAASFDEEVIMPKLLDKDRMVAQLAFQNRKVMLYDDVDDDSIFRCIYTLMRIREYDTKIGSKKPITIYINSCGGTVYDGMSLISLIESMQDDGYEINTVNMGYAMSMGFIISLVGTHKYCYRHSTYMYHDISSFIGGKLAQMKEDIKQTEQLRDMICDFVMSKTKLTREQLDDIHEHKRDVYYTSKQAIELGIAEEVL